MAEVEPPEGLSARKLVLETGKFNVLTTYSIQEALDTLATFPNVHALVLHAALCKGIDCNQVIGDVKARNPGLITIILSPVETSDFAFADHVVSSHEPQDLLDLLRSRFGDPRHLQVGSAGGGLDATSD
jgi:hypothetical protein